MGLAASQARYLALTARKSDLEFQSQTINTRRIQLAYKTAEIAQAYSEGMNNQRIKMSTKNNQGDTVWEEVSFKSLLDEGYIVIPAAGAAWDSASTDKNTCPYKKEGTASTITNYMLKNLDSLSQEFVISNASSELKGYLTQVSGKTNTYKLKATSAVLSGAAWNLFPDDIKSLFEAQSETDYAGIVKTSSTYDSYNRSRDIQSLLTSGQAQIITKEFYNFLCQHGFDPLGNTPVSVAVFAALQEAFDNGDYTVNKNQKSICDWRADETEKFAQRNFTEDDAQVLANYEAATAEIQRQDKVLEAQEKNIETQHKAIETELESISKVIQKNIETTFKIFS